MKNWRWYSLAILGGALLPLAFAPLQWVVIAFISPAIFFHLCFSATPRQAARLGYAFGLGFFGVGVSWVYVAIHDFGYTGWLVASLLTGLFVAFLALFFAAQAWFSVYLWQKLGKDRITKLLVALLLFPAVWVLFEWIRDWFLTGFPWLSLGYSQTDTWLNGYAPLLGVFGISWVVAVMAGCLWLVVTERRYILLIPALVLLVSGWALQQVDWSTPTGKPLRVSLVQGDVPQATKWDPAQIAFRKQTYARLTKTLWDVSDVIVWPENAMTQFYHELRPGYLDPLSEQAKKHHVALLIGTPYMDLDTGKYYSSFVALGTSVGVYNKRHLVPFGEFVPLQEFLRGLITFFDLPMSGFSRGATHQPLLKVDGQPLATSICYEDAFGEEVIQSLPEATLLLNGSNNAWYGHSWAANQHLQISRMRAIETRRDLIRATTNGISAYVDYHGRILSRTPQFVQAVLTHSVQPRKGETPYVLWGNKGILVLLMVVGLVLVFMRRLRPGSNSTVNDVV